MSLQPQNIDSPFPKKRDTSYSHVSVDIQPNLKYSKQDFKKKAVLPFFKCVSDSSASGLEVFLHIFPDCVSAYIQNKHEIHKPEYLPLHFPVCK